MASVEDFITIDKQLDSRLGQLSLSPNKSKIIPESGTFIIENHHHKRENVANGQVSHEIFSRNPRTKNQGKISSQVPRENLYDPGNYKNSTTSQFKQNPIDAVTTNSQLLKTQLEQNQNNCDFAGSDEDELEAYLTQEAQTKILSLKMKNDYLSQALAAAEKKIRQLSSVINDNTKKLKEADKEVIAVRKLLAASKASDDKKGKELIETKGKLASSNRECQELHKNINTLQRTLREDQKKLMSCQTQNNRLKQQLEETKSKVNTMTVASKAGRETYVAEITVNEKRCQDLQKQIQSLNTFIKKQNELIIILQQQKRNIAAAKAAQCLEEQFIALIAPFEDEKS